ncbi:MAG: hypothetical protein ACI9TF_001831 [Paracrocinitomix sp.]
MYRSRDFKQQSAFGRVEIVDDVIKAAPSPLRIGAVGRVGFENVDRQALVVGAYVTCAARGLGFVTPAHIPAKQLTEQRCWCIGIADGDINVFESSVRGCPAWCPEEVMAPLQTLK